MISISNRQRARKIDLRLLEKIAADVLADLNIREAELGIVLIGAKEMASLNENFLQHEGPTDVITFDYRSPDESTVHCPRSTVHGRNVKRLPTWDSGPGTHLHGEIFICIPEAERQATVFETRWQTEVARYIIHGILHLTGHDDLEPRARKKMKREENRLVRKLAVL